MVCEVALYQASALQVHTGHEVYDTKVKLRVVRQHHQEELGTLC